MTNQASPDTQIDVLRSVTDEAFRLLTATPRQRSAQSYLAQRGIDAAQLGDDWPLGYAPPGWTHLTDKLRSLGFDDQSIEDAGLARPSSRGTLIDVFRDRVIFPIHDQHGWVAGFIGRDLSGAPGAPKYLNTKQTPLFNKGAMLYGLHAAHAARGRPFRPVLVEGPLDALALTARARLIGDRDLLPLASCGTAVTATQAQLIRRLATGREIVVAMDADSAGRTAALTAGNQLLQAGLDVRLAVIPNGLDPTSFLANPASDIATFSSAAALPLITVQVQHAIASQRDRMQWVEGRVAAAREIATCLATYPPAFAAAQTEWIARILGVAPTTVTRAREEVTRRSGHRTRTRDSPATQALEPVALRSM
jgi:DNA primase